VTKTNNHPVDELLRLRGEKAAIEKRIDELRDLIIAMKPAERAGATAVARVVTQNRRSLDMKAVIYEMGEKWVDDRSTVKQMHAVRLEEIQ